MSESTPNGRRPLPEVLGLITARGGSKGIARKNICPVGGKPLLAWTAEAALGSRRLARTILTSDDHEIVDVARSYGIDAPFLRPAVLAEDDTPHIDVVIHALEWLSDQQDYRPDYVLLLQPTSPGRTADDIDDAIEFAIRRSAVAVIGVVETKAHPCLTRRLESDSTLTEFVACDLAYARRQALTPAYAINGALYVNRRDSLYADRTFTPPGALGYVMPPERSLDVDCPWDAHVADLVLRHRSEPSWTLAGEVTR